MLTKLKNAYKDLIHSQEFKNSGFLCGAFLMCNIEELEQTNWQLDFYNKESDTITSYFMENDIKVAENSEIFKEEGKEIEELKLEDVKTNFEDIKKQLDEILEKRNESVVKITIIVQKQIHPIWNILYITKKFNLLNIRINAIDGKLIDEKTVPLLSFEKGDNNNIRKIYE